MSHKMKYEIRYEPVREIVNGHRGGARSLVKKLDDSGFFHLSFSKISTVESCRYQYYLQYVKRVTLKKEPDGFVKGRAFHRAAASAFRRISRGEVVVADDAAREAIRLHGEYWGGQIKNALGLMIENRPARWDVAGVEEIFALDLGDGVPPCVGVVDLVLKLGDRYAVVDHKTGKDFWRSDAMQLAVYREHVLRSRGAKSCAGWFDDYRWVNDMRRIRKPAFRRTFVPLTNRLWNSALKRFRNGYESILRVESEGEKSSGGGSCWMCSFRSLCPKAVLDSWY